MRLTIEIIWNLEDELYSRSSLWDRITEAQLRILEIQAKRKKAQLAIIQETFGNQKGDTNGVKNDVEEEGKKSLNPPLPPQ